MLGKHLQHQILLQGSLFHKEIYFFYTEELHWWGSDWEISSGMPKGKYEWSQWQFKH